MKSGKIFQTTVLTGQATCKLKQAGNFLILLFFSLPDLHTAILGSADQKVLSLPSDVLQETKDIRSTISDVNPLAF
jgi:hypothetical protein